MLSSVQPGIMASCGIWGKLCLKKLIRLQSVRLLLHRGYLCYDFNFAEYALSDAYA